MSGDGEPAELEPAGESLPPSRRNVLRCNGKVVTLVAPSSSMSGRALRRPARPVCKNASNPGGPPALGSTGCCSTSITQRPRMPLAAATEANLVTLHEVPVTMKRSSQVTNPELSLGARNRRRCTALSQFRVARGARRLLLAVSTAASSEHGGLAHTLCTLGTEPLGTR